MTSPELFFSSLQWMVVGRIGALGRAACQNVAKAPKRGCVNVTAPLPKMVVNPVQDLQSKRSHVTTIAQVCTLYINNSAWSVPEFFGSGSKSDKGIRFRFQSVLLKV